MYVSKYRGFFRQIFSCYKKTHFTQKIQPLAVAFLLTGTPVLSSSLLVENLLFSSVDQTGSGGTMDLDFERQI